MVGPCMDPGLSTKSWTKNPKTLFGISRETWMVSGFVEDACDSTQGATRGNERWEKTILITRLTSILLVHPISPLAVGSGLCIQQLRLVVLVARLWALCGFLSLVGRWIGGRFSTARIDSCPFPEGFEPVLFSGLFIVAIGSVWWMQWAPLCAICKNLVSFGHWIFATLAVWGTLYIM